MTRRSLRSKSVVGLASPRASSARTSRPSRPKAVRTVQATCGSCGGRSTSRTRATWGIFLSSSALARRAPSRAGSVSTGGAAMTSRKVCHSLSARPRDKARITSERRCMNSSNCNTKAPPIEGPTRRRSSVRAGPVPSTWTSGGPPATAGGPMTYAISGCVRCRRVSSLKRRWRTRGKLGLAGSNCAIRCSARTRVMVNSTTSRFMSAGRRS
jgi:hypothetical protein